MIVSALMDLIYTVLTTMLGFIKIPQFPESITGSIDYFLDLVFNNASIVGLAIRWDTVKIAMPIVIAIIGLEKLYYGIMWILRKIPFLGIQ